MCLSRSIFFYFVDTILTFSCRRGRSSVCFLLLFILFILLALHSTQVHRVRHCSRRSVRCTAEALRREEEGGTREASAGSSAATRRTVLLATTDTFDVRLTFRQVRTVATGVCTVVKTSGLRGCGTSCDPEVDSLFSTCTYCIILYIVFSSSLFSPLILQKEKGNI